MKFTLKLQIDTATELAQFIQDMNMEIDLPFLSKADEPGVNKIIDELHQNIHEHCMVIINHEKTIDSLNRENDHLLHRLNAMPTIKKDVEITDRTESVPESQSSISETIIEETVTESPKTVTESPKTETKERKSPFANLKPIACAECGASFKPHHNRIKSCDTCRSKKVRKPMSTTG